MHMSLYTYIYIYIYIYIRFLLLRFALAFALGVCRHTPVLNCNESKQRQRTDNEYMAEKHYTNIMNTSRPIPGQPRLHP